MREVTEFEARLLRILTCLMHRTSAEQTLPLLVHTIRRPRCLSRNCVELVQDMLSKGVTEWLARSDWSTARFLQNGELVSGRLWNRHSTDSLQLSFSANSMELLIWMTAENLAAPRKAARIGADTLTSGDRLLQLMSFSALQTTPVVQSLLEKGGFARNGLLALLFPAEISGLDNSCAPSVAEWCLQDRAWILEAIQSRLARQWFRTERDKRQLTSDSELCDIGMFQTTVLDTLLNAAEQHSRKDLCLFLLQTGHQLFRTVTSSPDNWFHRLDVRSLRMADRSRVYEAGLAWFRGLQRLSQWTVEAQNTGFYDDNYQADQLWKAEWERLDGQQICERARQVVEQTDPVRTVAADDTSTSGALP